MGTHYRGRPAEVRALELLIKLVRCAASVSDRLERHLKEDGFTGSQFGLLEALLHLGPLEPCELGPKLLTSRPNIVLLVDQLERRGLVRRVPIPHDRRRILVELTAKGRAAIVRTFTNHLQRLLVETSRLSAREQEDLARLCRKLGKA
jgi:MarR family transcriptional regulator, 2-MHQ and catechol-resistance regulon repressor